MQGTVSGEDWTDMFVLQAEPLRTNVWEGGDEILQVVQIPESIGEISRDCNMLCSQEVIFFLPDEWE